MGGNSQRSEYKISDGLLKLFSLFFLFPNWDSQYMNMPILNVFHFLFWLLPFLFCPELPVAIISTTLLPSSL